MKNKIGTVLIIVGIIIIAIPLIGRYMANKKQEELMSSFLEQTSLAVESDEYEELTDVLDWGVEENNQNDIDEGNEEAEASAEAFEEQIRENVSNVENSENIKAKPDAIALLEIKKIDVKLPVAESVELSVLKFALGHMSGTAKLGSIGNAVVAGHRSHSFGTYFNRLDEMEVGDEILVTTNGKTYTYTVYETLIVEPDDTSVLRNSSNHRVLTLITCHPLYTSTHRLIVHAVVNE